MPYTVEKYFLVVRQGSSRGRVAADLCRLHRGSRRSAMDAAESLERQLNAGSTADAAFLAMREATHVNRSAEPERAWDDLRWVSVVTPRQAARFTGFARWPCHAGGGKRGLVRP